MSMDIPGEKAAEDAQRRHEAEQHRHEEDIRDHKEHPEDGTAYHHMKEDKVVMDEYIGHEEKADRRQQDEKDVDIKETYNTMFRNEESA